MVSLAVRIDELVVTSIDGKRVLLCCAVLSEVSGVKRASSSLNDSKHFLLSLLFS
jgi:hypothetical protein